MEIILSKLPLPCDMQWEIAQYVRCTRCKKITFTRRWKKGQPAMCLYCIKEVKTERGLCTFCSMWSQNQVDKSCKLVIQCLDNTSSRPAVTLVTLKPRCSSCQMRFNANKWIEDYREELEARKRQLVKTPFYFITLSKDS